MTQAVSCQSAIIAYDTVVTNAPATSGGFEPTYDAMRPADKPRKNIPTVAGSMNRPACVTVAPKPKPALSGVCTNAGRNAIGAYTPAPNSTGRGLVGRPAGRGLPRMPTSGTPAPASTTTHTTTSTSARTSRPTTRPDSQPQVGP